MLTDLVFFNGASIDDIIMSLEEAGIWYFARNIDSIALSKLGEMLNIASYDTLQAGFTLVSEPGEQMLFTFPEILQSKLKTITDAEIDSVIEAWSKIEEFYGMTPEDCKTYLQEVRAFLNTSEEPVYIHIGV